MSAPNEPENTSAQNLCRCLLAIRLDQKSDRAHSEETLNEIRQFVIERNTERVKVSGVMLYQEDVFVLFVEAYFKTQMELLGKVVLGLKRKEPKFVYSVKVLVFNEQFKQRLVLLRFLVKGDGIGRW